LNVTISSLIAIIFFADQGEASELTKKVEDACNLLVNYNGRLAAELQERKRVARMLRDYLVSQKTALSESEKKLQVRTS
jgi:regulator of Ty1 transposition protein 103